MPLVPEYQALLADLAAQNGPSIAEMSPAEAREMYRLMRPASPDLGVGAVQDGTIPGPAGDIPVRIHTPQGDGPFPVFVNFHGGGWVMGDLDTADAVSRDICRTAGCVVVSVDYRLASEHPFPAAVDAAYAAALRNAGVSAEAARLDGLVHDFFATAQVFASSRAGFERACQALRPALA